MQLIYIMYVLDFLAAMPLKQINRNKIIEINSFYPAIF